MTSEGTPVGTCTVTLSDRFAVVFIVPSKQTVPALAEGNEPNSARMLAPVITSRNGPKHLDVTIKISFVAMCTTCNVGISDRISHLKVAGVPTTANSYFETTRRFEIS